MIEKLKQFIVCAALVTACGNALLYSQVPGGAAKPQPDVLIFTDGEKLIGQLKSAKGDSVVFKSDMAGEVTVAWSKIQELSTSHPFAVIGKNAKFVRHMDVSQVPQGNIAMTDQKIAVQAAAGASRTVPVADAGFMGRACAKEWPRAWRPIKPGEPYAPRSSRISLPWTASASG